jgi:hypothetical protein
LYSSSDRLFLHLLRHPGPVKAHYLALLDFVGSINAVLLWGMFPRHAVIFGAFSAFSVPSWPHFTAVFRLRVT